MRTSTSVLALSLLLCGAARAADPVTAGGVADLVGPRTLGLSADIGAATGNEGLYVNPGAIAARQRYAIEGGALFDRRGATTTDRFLGGSIVDSESSPVAAGVSYQRIQEHGFYKGGSLVHLALAGPLAEGFFFGVSGKWISLGGQDVTVTAPPAPPLQLRSPDISSITADAGVLWQVAQLVSVGVAGYNLVPVSHPDVAPLGMGAGIAIGSDRSFQVTGDWRTDFDKRSATAGSNRFAAGAEALLFDLVPVRAGWMKDEVLGTSWWSAGAGLVAPNGVALDVGYRQSTSDPKARMIAASLKLFVNVPR